MASSSSFVNSPQAKYDVFLSFRGEDTRDNFTSHLYAALCTQKIQTFIDNNLVRGEEISPSLLKAIEESKLSVIIFSENYATSKWCLEEAAKILECKERNGQMVIPVFYRVDPSHVRNQTGSFRDAFANHEKHLQEKMDKVQNWRVALKEAANLAGWSSLDVRPESKLIEEIIRDILKKLNSRSHSQSTDLVGIDSQIIEVESSLCLQSPENSTLGIWGMGGIGKTTIARTVYSRICSQFEGFYFFENVKEALKRHAMIDLQYKLLSGILGKECLDERKSNLENDFVKDLLSRKKVFIVIDDVDDSRQLRDLFGGWHDIFGAGSKVIVTSRDRHVLEVLSVNKTYEVKGLNDDDSLTLFSRNAFKKDSPPSKFIEFSKRVVSYAKGNPLALIVLGSDLFGRNKKIWAAALKKLGKMQSPKIQNILRISYDGLDSDQKDVFLDIAYFFKGENWDNVTKLLDSCYSSLEFDISVLIDKSLITISKRNKLEMHDLLQEMAYSIVHEESNRPEERSRLYDLEEVSHVLKKKKGSDKIEGISLCLPRSREIHLESDAFAGMNSLRFLKFYGSHNKVHLPCGGLGYLPDEMRYLHWDRFPSKSLPQNFFGINCNLVKLSLRSSTVKRLWTGVHAPVNLKFIDLSSSKYLTEIPDLSMANKIESIDLGYCHNLIGVHSSIQHLNNLEILDLRGCRNLRSLPSSIDSKCLRNLNLKNCTNVKKCPEISGNLIILDLQNTAIKEVPQSISKLKVLGRLDLSHCSSITTFPEVTRNTRALYLSGDAIEKVPSSIEFLTGLAMLTMIGCKKLSSLPSTICKLKSLKRLDLRGCPKLESFPEILEPMERLRTLWLNDCVSLKRLPNSIYNLQSLRDLRLSGSAIEDLPSSIKQLSLQKLEIQGLKCRKNLRNILSIVLNLRELHSLYAGENVGLQLVPFDINIRLCPVKYLYLNRCNLLEIPSALCNISWLEGLDLSYNNFESLPTNIKQLSTLCWLNLQNCKRLRFLPELPHSLERLDKRGCESLQTLSVSSQCEIIDL